MRQSKLNLHYRLLKEEYRLRGEVEWIQALRQELDNRSLIVETEIHDLMRERLRIEKELCPVQIVKEKKERTYQRKVKKGTETDLVAQLEHLTSAEKEQLRKYLEGTRLTEMTQKRGNN